MDNYLIANKVMGNTHEDYLKENVASLIPDIVLSITLGALAVGSFKAALDGSTPNIAKKLKAKVDELRNKECDGKNAMQRVRIKLSKALEDSKDFIHHALEEVTKNGSSEAPAKKIAKKLKLDEEETHALETYLTAIAYKIHSVEKLTNA